MTLPNEVREADEQPAPPPKPKMKKLRGIAVMHRVDASLSSYAVVAKRFASDIDYVCRFFDTPEGAEAYATKLGEPCALFKVCALTASNSEEDQT